MNDLPRRIVLGAVAGYVLTPALLWFLYGYHGEELGTIGFWYGSGIIMGVLMPRK